MYNIDTSHLNDEDLNRDESPGRGRGGGHAGKYNTIRCNVFPIVRAVIRGPDSPSPTCSGRKTWNRSLRGHIDEELSWAGVGRPRLDLHASFIRIRKVIAGS
jgi:hypothetical protein